MPGQQSYMSKDTNPKNEKKRTQEGPRLEMHPETGFYRRTLRSGTDSSKDSSYLREHMESEGKGELRYREGGYLNL